MEQIYILNYNNYSNRQIKRPLDLLSAYNKYIVYQETKCNFNENDKINTTYVAGRSSNSYDGTGNYCLVTDYDDSQYIASRWFIISQYKTRGGQWQLTLKRDTISDYYQEFLSTIANIKRGIVSTDNKLIYNNENFNLNQIKTNEDLLKDETGCSWIVGYYTEQSSGTDNFPLTASANISQIETVTYDDTYENFVNDFRTMTSPIELRYHDEDGNITGYNPDIYYTIEYDSKAGIHYNSKFYLNNLNQITTTKIKSTASGATIKTLPLDISTLDKYQLYSNSLQLISSNYDSSVIKQYNNKYVKFTDGTIKYVSFNFRYADRTRVLTTSNSLYTYFYNQLINQFGTATIPLNTFINAITFNYKQGIWSLEIKDVAEGMYNISIDTNKKELIDAPYKMFCMPYGTIDITVGTTKITTQSKVNMAIAQALNTKYGETFIKDLQLLPYCPCREYIQADGSLIVPDKEINYAVIKENDSTCGYMLFCQESSFTFNIFKELKVQNVKLENECDMYRLSSPNGNGVFEFNLAKNGGLDFINVDCTYMPFNPFIHLTPNFKNLYGEDFNDYRGLICGGDFSLPKTTSAWETYQLNSKNYQAIFDRGIENLEINLEVEKLNQLTGIFTNTLTSTAAGASAGKYLGSIGIGTALGAISGAATSIIDYTQNEKLRKETVSYQKDIYSLQNGNIKAQAQGIAKTTAFNINNKVFPILEYYTCSESEKIQVSNYLKYSGYTLGIIDYLNNYVNYDNDFNFIQGQIIRTDIEDNQIAEDINSELTRGVYINGTI